MVRISGFDFNSNIRFICFMFLVISEGTYYDMFLGTVWPLTALNLEPKFSIPRSAKVDEVVLANGFIGSVISDYFWYVLFYSCTSGKFSLTLYSLFSPMHAAISVLQLKCLLIP